MGRYQVPQEERLQYAGIYLLEYMINTPAQFAVFLDENDSDLEPILEWLLEKQLVEIHQQERYQATGKGKSLLKRYMQRYSEYLHAFDVFAHVDLGQGEFALQFWQKYQGGPEWDSFKKDERFEDLRIAVADYLELNPVEVVFMSFINERRFGRQDTGWQFDLLLGSVWDEITEICETAIQWQQLGYSDAQGEVPAEQVMEDVIWQGFDLVDALDQLGSLPPLKTPSQGQGNDRVEVTRQFATLADHFQDKIALMKKPWFTI